MSIMGFCLLWDYSRTKSEFIVGVSYCWTDEYKLYTEPNTAVSQVQSADSITNTKPAEGATWFNKNERSGETEQQSQHRVMRVTDRKCTSQGPANAASMATVWLCELGRPLSLVPYILYTSDSFM